jgi:hypothetical protein
MQNGAPALLPLDFLLEHCLDWLELPGGMLLLLLLLLLPLPLPPQPLPPPARRGY